MNSLCESILLFASFQWNISQPSLLDDGKGLTTLTSTIAWASSWVEADDDSHHVERDARAKWLDDTTMNMSIYPSTTVFRLGSR